jgi:hypothetical protein
MNELIPAITFSKFSKAVQDIFTPIEIVLKKA